MFGGCEPFIITEDDEYYQKYGLTLDDLNVLISPSVLSPQSHPMMSPHATTQGDTADSIFFDVNELPSLTGIEDHTGYFNSSPAMVSLESSSRNTASMPPPVMIGSMRVPSSREKKSKKTKRKSVFSFDLNDVNKFSNGQATPVIRTDANSLQQSNGSVSSTYSSGVSRDSSPSVSGNNNNHPAALQQATATLTDSCISFNLGLAQEVDLNCNAVNTLPSLSSLGYAPQVTTSISGGSPSTYFQDAAVILNKPPPHRGRSMSSGDVLSGTSSSVGGSPSGWQQQQPGSQLSSPGDIKEIPPPSAHHRSHTYGGSSSGAMPSAADYSSHSGHISQLQNNINGQYNNAANNFDVNAHPQYNNSINSSSTEGNLVVGRQPLSSYVTAFRSPKNALDLLTAEDIADLEFLRIDLSDDPYLPTSSDEYGYDGGSSVGINTSSTHSSSTFSPPNPIISALQQAQQKQQSKPPKESTMKTKKTSFGRGVKPLSAVSSAQDVLVKSESQEEDAMGDASAASGGAVGGNGKDDSSRASKSLSAISKRFIEYYGGEHTIKYISGQLDENDFTDDVGITARIDGAAEALGVHVRRIYELIKILETLSLVSFGAGKRGKFAWKGTRDFLFTLGSMQADAMLKYPEVAHKSGLQLMEKATSPAESSSRRPLHLRAHHSLLSIDSDYTLDFDSSRCVSNAASTNNIMASLHQQQQGGGTGGGLMNDSDFDSDAEDSMLFDSAALQQEFSGQQEGKSVPLSGSRRSVEEVTVIDLDNLSTIDAQLNIPTLAIPNQFSQYRQNSNYMSDTSAVSSAVTSAVNSAANTNNNSFSSNYTMNINLGGSFSRAAGAVKVGKLKKSPLSASGGTPKTTPRGEQEDQFMMESICKSFLQLFLVGLDAISMGYAIQQLVPKDEAQTLQDYNKKNATKIRRVYDVANVLCSVNLIRKQVVSSHRIKKTDSKSDNKALLWSSFSPLLIREHYVRHQHTRRPQGPHTPT